MGKEGGVALLLLCPPGYFILHQSRLEGQGVPNPNPVPYKNTCGGSGLGGPQHVSGGQGWDRGFVLVYHVPCDPALSFPERAGFVSMVLLTSPREMMSTSWNLNCGVSRGMIISLLLYMRPLGKVFSFTVLCPQYVADTQL